MTACSLCHAGQPHYLIENCQQCHADPHKPLSSLRDPIKPAREECLTCHAEVGQVVPAGWIPATFCQVCHRKEAQDLAETITNQARSTVFSATRDRIPQLPVARVAMACRMTSCFTANSGSV